MPITRLPYRIDIAFEADFLTLEAHLSKGQVREMRQSLKELLRQTVLVEEDLELWEASVKILPEHDSGRVVAVAEQKRVLEVR